MKGRVIALDQWAGREAAALMVDGILEDIIIAPPKGIPPPGTIFAARAERPLKGTGGQFVRLPGDEKAFLKANAPQGRIIPVQVSGYAEPGKAVPVTNRLVLKGAFAILTPRAASRSVARSIKGDEAAALKAFAQGLDLPEGTGVILRTAATDAYPDDITADIDALRPTLEALATMPAQATLLAPGRSPAAWAKTEWTGNAIRDEKPGSFDRHGIIDALSAALAPERPLPSGGSVVIEATRALIAVDVNTGGAAGGAQGLTATLEAIDALPRLLRLRGLGGQITIDCAPFGKPHRRTVEQRITRAFAADTVETSFAGWTPLGHLELTRKRERCPVPQEA